MKYLISLKSQNYQKHSNFRKIKDLIFMGNDKSIDSPAKEKSLFTKNDDFDPNENKPFFAKGIFSYKDKGTQGVITLFGYELTAPTGLKNPGIVYLSFIFVNLLIFFILKSFISG